MQIESHSTFSDGQRLKTESLTDTWSIGLPNVKFLDESSVIGSAQSIQPNSAFVYGNRITSQSNQPNSVFAYGNSITVQPNQPDSVFVSSNSITSSAVDSMFRLPVRFQRTGEPTLRLRQLWEGTVISCDAGSFTARVVDRTNPLNPDEAVTFELNEISADDLQLVQPGAAFYWTLGTERSPAGQIRNVNFVNFRRLPNWKESSFREAEKRSERILSLFGQE
jgi:hypothetical protein